MTTEELDAPDRCPNCGRQREEWSENDGLGVISGGVTYCSSGCALKEAATAYED